MLRGGSEKGEDQQFWNALLGDVLGCPKRMQGVA
jgi:hypothetical protein